MTRGSEASATYDSTFSRTVWRLYGGANGLAMCFWNRYSKNYGLDYEVDLVHKIIESITDPERPVGTLMVRIKHAPLSAPPRGG